MSPISWQTTSCLIPLTFLFPLHRGRGVQWMAPHPPQIVTALTGGDLLTRNIKSQGISWKKSGVQRESSIKKASNLIRKQGQGIIYSALMTTPHLTLAHGASHGECRGHTGLVWLWHRLGHRNGITVKSHELLTPTWYPFVDTKGTLCRSLRQILNL